MKKFYLTTLILTIFLLITYSIISIAIPKEYFVAMKLEGSQEKWNLSMNDDLGKSLENYKPKEELIEFINNNKMNYTGGKEVFIFGITAFIFSLIGYLREKKIKNL